MSTPPATPSPRARRWAHALDPDRRGVAFVMHDEEVLHAPSVEELIDGVWHAHPDAAHTLLRPRLHSTRPDNELDRALAKVCARKLCTDVRGEPGPVRAVGRDLRAHAAASRAHHAEASALPTPPVASVQALKQLVATLPTAGRRATRARPVVALLVTADGAVLDAVRNTHGTHRMHHAEVNLMQRWRVRGLGPLPDGAEVWVSLQSCRMCAAMLVSEAGPAGLRVRYLAPETGRFGSHTALQARGWEAPLQTP